MQERSVWTLSSKYEISLLICSSTGDKANRLVVVCSVSGVGGPGEPWLILTNSWGRFMSSLFIMSLSPSKIESFSLSLVVKGASNDLSDSRYVSSSSSVGKLTMRVEVASF